MFDMDGSNFLKLGTVNSPVQITDQKMTVRQAAMTASKESVRSRKCKKFFISDTVNGLCLGHMEERVVFQGPVAATAKNCNPTEPNW